MKKKQLIMRDRDRNGNLFAAGSTHPLPHRRALEFSTATVVKGFVKHEAKLKFSEGEERQ